LGVDLRALGIQLIPAGGHGRVGVIATFLELAYEGAEFKVLLDNGGDTQATRIELEASFGDRVTVQLLARTEIERYFDRDAVGAWLRERGASDDDVDAWLTRFASGDITKRALREVAQRLRHREYNVVTDGMAIARLMREQDIPSEIRTLIFGLVA
jgi:hypothetical protein